MVRRYRDPIAVTLSAEGEPTSFTWRGCQYRVWVIGRWRLAARWWEGAGAATRQYFRVQTADQQVFELYHDTTADAWVLDVCQD